MNSEQTFRSVMILEEKKFMDYSKLNGIAIKQNQSNASLISRSLSSCSTDDFLPTFESEDDDWRKFGWLLEFNDIKLPCLDDDEKVLKLDDVKEAHKSVKVEQREECVDPSEFFLNKHETVSHCSEAIQSTIDSISGEPRTPRTTELPTPYLCISERPVSEGSQNEEGRPRSAFTEQVEQLVGGDGEDKEADEPIAKRTRKALSKKCPDLNEPSVENKVHFIIGDEDEKMDEDNSELETETVRYRSDSLCDSLLDYGPPTMCSSMVTSLAEKPRAHEISDSEMDDEPVAKRTRHVLPSISLDDGIVIPVTDWQPILQVERSVSPTKARNAARKRKYTKRLYCLCQTPYDRKRFYVGCDGCYGWFHPACIGISEAEAIDAEQYYCPKCVRVKQEVDNV
ncbi:unnamed protein product [Toxocara canis]|uniref:PHD-type domain-containing protein n=1 Tax=Toxocara canis TaxID=6265 RepID=A0A3P7GV39_TOXCA|nr:unnamed protein product [Toxocara canis]